MPSALSLILNKKGGGSHEGIASLGAAEKLMRRFDWGLVFAPGTFPFRET